MRKLLFAAALAAGTALWADLYMAEDSTMYTYGPMCWTSG